MPPPISDAEWIRCGDAMLRNQWSPRRGLNTPPISREDMAISKKRLKPKTVTA